MAELSLIVWKNMKDRKKTFTHSFFRQATALKPPHQYPGVEVKPGFTLVELMVVISIIAMLLAILLPALSAVRRTAYRTMCKENLHGCGVAFKMYLDDNTNTMPIIYNMPNSTKQDDPNSVSLYASIGKYLSGKEALKCPADRWPDKNSSYFKEEGSSYEYNTNLGGKKIEDDWFAKRFGTMEVWILHDYDGFHGSKAPQGGERNVGDASSYTLGSFMYLFADTLVADRTRSK
jgi:prepilin-type N-terminal cleavage/methylation domain-containing protein